MFAEGLNLVSGMEVGHSGVWVGAAPQLLFIPDRDGDDKPDAEPLRIQNPAKHLDHAKKEVVAARFFDIPAAAIAEAAARLKGLKAQL